MGWMLRIRLALLVTAMTAVIGAALAVPCAAQRKAYVSYVSGEILAEPVPGGNYAAAMNAMRAVGKVTLIDTINNIFKIRILPGLTVPQAVATLSKSATIRFAEPNYLYKIHSANDPLYASQWAIPQTHTDQAWLLWTADTTTVVPALPPYAPRIIAMLDTGVAFGHQELFSRIQTNASGLLTGYDFVNNNPNPFDDNGHGTHTAGIAVARINDNIGTAGIAAWNGSAGSSEFDAVKIMPIKVMDANGSGSAANIIAGLNFARTSATPAHIIYVGLGAEADSVALQTAVSSALAAGIVVVVAAGNDSSSLPTFPASYAGVVSVGSTDQGGSDPLSAFSNYGPWVRVAAPGSNILSTANNGNYAYMSGTSQAAALVAGEAALIRSMSPTLTQTQVSNLLTKMVDPYTPYNGNSIATGAGRVNVRDAIVAAKDAAGAGLVSVALPANIGNGMSITGGGTVTLANTASSAVSVVLTWANTDMKINGAASPQTITVSAGTSSAPFTVSSINAAVPATVTVTATQTISGSTLIRTASTNLLNILGTLVVAPTALKSGAQALATITLSVPCPVGGLSIAVASSATAVADTTNAGGTPIATVAFLAGDLTKTFYVTAANVSANGTCNVTATFNTDVRTVAMTVAAPVLTGIALNPTVNVVGQTSQLTVTLDGKAATGGVDVAVTSSATTVMVNPGATPGTVTVPAGQTSVTIATPVTTSTAVNPITVDTPVTLTAVLGAATKTATLTVRPLISTVSISPNQAKGGTTPSPVGTVTLNQAAPAGGTTIALTSSDSSAAVPASITIPAGATTGTFTVTTTAVANDTTAVISATNQFATRTTTFVTQAPALSGLSLALNSILVGSTTTGTVVLDSPAPTGGTVVTLASSNTSVITVPATVTVAAGATSATFTATSQVILAAGNATITATAGSISRTANITVAPLLAAISVSQAQARGGATPAPTALITLNQPAPTGGVTVALTSSNGAAITVPATAAIAAGASSATVTLTTHAVSAVTPVTLTATLSGVARTTVMTITPPAISAFTMTPAVIVGGSNATNSVASITLDSPAPTGGLTITVGSTNTAAAEPWSATSGGSAITSVTIAAGATSTTYVVRGKAVSSDTNVTLSASVGSQTSTAALLVKALLQSISLTPSSATGGTNSVATVTLAGPAPTGGVAVTLTSDALTAATVPASVTVAATATTATFTVTTLPVPLDSTANIGASLNGTLRSAALRVLAPTVTNLSIAPALVVNGSAATTSTCTVTVSGRAPASFSVTLGSSNTAVATVPATVTIPAGTTTATFTATSVAVSADNYTVITATSGSSSKSVSMTVKPLLLSVSLAPVTTIGGTAVTGTVTLNAPSPVGGTVVSLSTSNALVASTPSTVTVLAGATTATFTVVDQAVAANTNVNVSATLNGATRNAVLTVQTPTLTTLTLAPAIINAGEQSTATVTLTGPAPVGGTSLTITVTNSSGTSASAPQTVIIPAGATSGTFTVSTTGFTGVNRTATVSAVITGVAGSKSGTLTIRGN